MNIMNIESIAKIIIKTEQSLWILPFMIFINKAKRKLIFTDQGQYYVKTLSLQKPRQCQPWLA